MGKSDRREGTRGGAFEATHWSVVVRAGKASSPQAKEALEQLCATYWPPLYAYVRRRGYSPHDAEDITQGFFFQILERDFLGGAQRSKGKFRSFLLASLNYFLANRYHHDHAQKRDRHKLVFLDEKAAEQDFSAEPASSVSPEAIYEKKWAETLMGQALRTLEEEYQRQDKVALFQTLRPFLADEAAPGQYQTLGAALDMKPNHVAVTVNRLRASYRDKIRDEVARTVVSPDEIDREMKHVLEILSRR